MRVAVLDDALEGVLIRKVGPQQWRLRTDDGLELEYHSSELVAIEAQPQWAQQLRVSPERYKQFKSAEPQRRSKVAHLSKNDRGIPEFDLHIEKLVPQWQKMTAFDILNFQLDTARQHIEFAMRNRIPRIVLIHGVGEGVLKTELEYLLGRYPELTWQEASYLRYGLGAVELRFKQSV